MKWSFFHLCMRRWIEIRAYQHALAPDRARRFIDTWEACIEGLEQSPTN